MAKESYSGANVEINSHTFSHLINRTNQLIYDMSTVVVTTAPVATPNTALGGFTSGNAHVSGYFSSNVLSAAETLRGGTVENSANLSISSNVVFSSANVIAMENTVDSFVSNTIVTFEKDFYVNNASSNTDFTVLNYDITSNTYTLGANSITITSNNTLFDSANLVFGTANTDSITVESTVVFQGPIEANNGAVFTDSVSMDTITSNVDIGTSMTTGSVNIGGASQTGTLNIGISTANQIINIATGNVGSGSTKRINLGTVGAAGSNTVIKIGSNTAQTIVDNRLTANGVFLIGSSPNKTTIQYTANTSRTHTIPDIANANFVLTEGTQTINGVKTFGSNTVFSANATVSGISSFNGNTFFNAAKNTVNNDIEIHGVAILGGNPNKATVTYTGNTATTFSIPVSSTNANFVVTESNQTLNGIKTFSQNTVFSDSITVGDVATFNANVHVTGVELKVDNNIEVSGDVILGNNPNKSIFRYTANTERLIYVPDVGATSTLMMLGGAQTVDGAKTFSANSVFNGNVSVSALSTFSGNVSITAALLDVTNDAKISGNLIIGSAANKATIQYPTNAARVYTLPNIGVSGTFTFLEGTQTFSGAKTFTQNTVFSDQVTVTSNGNFSSSLHVTANVYSAAIQTNIAKVGSNPNKISLIYAANTARNFSFTDVGADANFIMSEGNQTVNGIKTLTGNTAFSGGIYVTAPSTFTNNVAFSDSITVADVSTFNSNVNFSDDIVVSGRVTSEFSTIGSNPNKATVIYTANTVRVFEMSDIGSNATFAFLEGTQTFSGAKTFSTNTLFTAAKTTFNNDISVSGNVILGTAVNKATIRYNANTARDYLIPDVGANGQFVITEGSQTINGIKTFGSNTVFSDSITVADVSTFSSNVVFSDSITVADVSVFNANVSFNGILTSLANTTINGILKIGNNPNKATLAYIANNAWTYTVPDVSGNSTFALLEGTQTFSGAKTFSTNTTFNGTRTFVKDIQVSGNVILGSSTNKATIRYVTDAARTVTIPAVPSDSDFVMTTLNQTIGGIKTFSANSVFNGADNRFNGDLYIGGDLSVSGDSALTVNTSLTDYMTIYENLYFYSGSNFTGSILPSANLTYDIGASTSRIRNIWANTLYLTTQASSTSQAVRADRTLQIQAGQNITVGGSGTGAVDMTNNRSWTISASNTNLSYSTNATNITISSSTGTNTSIPSANSSTAGAMSAAYAGKLEGIESGAQVNIGTNLGRSANGTTVILTSSTGSDTTIPSANSSTAGAMSAAYAGKLEGIESGAQVNDVTSVSGRTGAIVLTKSDVGLSSVTNNAQIKKLSSSTSGNVPIWNGTTGDSLSDGYAVETTLIGSSSKLVRADAIKAYVDNLLSSNDAMVFKGTLGSGGSVTTLPTTHDTGWTYKVITAGTYAGVVAEVGDMFISLVDRAGSGNTNSDWSLIQTNIDGAVTGPESSVDNHIALFDGCSGKIIKSSGVSLGNGRLTIGTSGIATGSTTFDANQTTNTSITITVPGTNITSTANTTTRSLYSSTGTDVTISSANSSQAGWMSSTDYTKLSGIESGATGDQTAGEILTLLKTVDGAGSGLDADLLDGLSSASYVQTSGTQTIAGTKTFSSTISGSINGNAATATSLQTARTISLSGDVSGSASFNGGSNISIAATVANDSHLHTRLANTISYTFDGSDTPNNIEWGAQIGFVQSANSYPSYGSVFRGKTYANGGGSFELYFPYNAANGGSSMRYRMGQFDTSTWTNWKTIVDSENIGSQSVNSAATWTTSRTITIGDTGKSVNGSGNVAWSLSEIGAADKDLVLTAGDGLSGGGNLTTNRSFAVDSTVIRTTGNQTLGGTKTFSSAITASAGVNVTGNIAVTGTVDGRDVASDGSKLDTIESGAQSNVPTNLSTVANTTTRSLYSSTGTDVTILGANSTQSGWMTSADKTKLDSIEAGATADQSASEILTLIKTVDGAGSGLDADLFDGANSSSYIQWSQVGSLYVPWANITGKPDPTINLSITDSNGTTKTDSVTLTDVATGTYNLSLSFITLDPPSDYRLKNNVNTLSLNNAISDVMSLRPVEFYWNDETRGIEKEHGFLAHEAQTIAPYAVDGEKDAVDENGSAIYQTMNYEKLVPTLTAALQEAILEIENLKTEIQILKDQVNGSN